MNRPDVIYFLNRRVKAITFSTFVQFLELDELLREELVSIAVADTIEELHHDAKVDFEG